MANCQVTAPLSGKENCLNLIDTLMKPRQLAHFRQIVLLVTFITTQFED